MSETDLISLLDGAVRLEIQKNGFRPGLDTVLLAASCPIKSGQHFLDAGCATGGAGLCVLARVADAHMTGVELQAPLADLARANLALNARDGEIVSADITRYPYQFKAPVFDHIICNPPYWEEGAHSVSPDESRAKSMGYLAEDAGLEQWIKACHVAVKPKGSVSISFRADGLDMLLHAMRGRFGEIEIFPLWPKAGQAAKRVIVRGRRDRKGATKLLAGLVLHQEDGNWTPEAAKILRAPNQLF